MKKFLSLLTLFTVVAGLVMGCSSNSNTQKMDPNMPGMQNGKMQNGKMQDGSSSK